MRLVLLGPPGAGKGTQAQVLSKFLNIPHISTGEMLREALREGTALGIKARACMDRGELVPDTVVIEIVRERLLMPDAKIGFILDGFPRTPEQGQSLDHTLHELGMPLDLTLYFKTSLSVISRRLGGRRICGQCGKTYNIKNYPPKVVGVCDVCQGQLMQRPDDKEDAIENRLRVYEKQTAPLIDYYSKKMILEELCGDLEVVEINHALEEIFRRRGFETGSGIKDFE